MTQNKFNSMIEVISSADTEDVKFYIVTVCVKFLLQDNTWRPWFVAETCNTQQEVDKLKENLTLQFNNIMFNGEFITEHKHVYFYDETGEKFISALNRIIAVEEEVDTTVTYYLHDTRQFKKMVLRKQ